MHSRLRICCYRDRRPVVPSRTLWFPRASPRLPHLSSTATLVSLNKSSLSTYCIFRFPDSAAGFPLNPAVFPLPAVSASLLLTPQDTAWMRNTAGMRIRLSIPAVFPCISLSGNSLREISHTPWFTHMPFRFAPRTFQRLCSHVPCRDLRQQQTNGLVYLRLGLVYL